MTSVPDVSVVIPAYNALPYLHRCLESVVAQTLGTDRIEVVVVDDGSTDGTGAAVDEWADRHPGLFRVVHFPVGSGGPAGPRNTALDLATGRYVFFLDADDHLGHEALERLVAAADENGSDVVAGQMATTSGRGLPGRTFRRTDLDADLATSGVYWSLSALKLFRRGFLEEHHIRFPTEFPVLSDQPFTALAYFRASRISVLADYDYYFAEWRDDGKHVTRSGSVADRIDVVEAMCALVVREITDPARRTRLLHRHLQGDLWRVMRMTTEVPAEEQEALLARCAELVRARLDPELDVTLTPDRRVVYELCRRGLLDQARTALAATDEDFSAEVLVEGGRAYADLPFFRDPVVGLPDELFETTDRLRPHEAVERFWFTGSTLHLRGAAGLRRVTRRPTVTVVLRHLRRAAPERSVPATVDDDGFSASIDLDHLADGDPLSGGTWTVHVRIEVDGIVRTPRLGSADSETSTLPAAVGVARSAAGGGRVVRARVAPGGLVLQVGRPAVRPAEVAHAWDTSWDGTDLVVRVDTDGRVDAPAAMELVATGGAVHQALVTVADDHLEGRVPVAGLAEGRWTARLRWGSGAEHLTLPVPADGALPPVRWRQGARVLAAIPEEVGGALALRVGRVGLAELARERVRRRA